MNIFNFFQVLTDDEKRQQFDNGEDPLDPESGKAGGGAHYFHHFQYGSPFQFKFHFNQFNADFVYKQIMGVMLSLTSVATGTDRIIAVVYQKYQFLRVTWTESHFKYIHISV